MPFVTSISEAQASDILKGRMVNEDSVLPELIRDVMKTSNATADFATIQKAVSYRSENMKKIGVEVVKSLEGGSVGEAAGALDDLPEFGPSFMLHQLSEWHSADYTEVLEGTHGASGPKEKVYPNTDAGKQLHNILVELSTSSSNYKGKTLKLVVAGGDGTLHSFLKGFVHVHANYPSLLEKLAVTFEVYVLPLGMSNKLASFLAYYDPWYCGTIYTTLCNDLPIVPCCSLGVGHEAPDRHATEHSGEKTVHHRMTMVLSKLTDLKLNKFDSMKTSSIKTNSSSVKSVSSPNSGRSQTSLVRFKESEDDHEAGEDEGYGATQRLKDIRMSSLPSATIAGHLLERYVADADRRLEVSVFSCEGWAVEGKRRKHFTLPFCTQAEIGLAVHLAEHEKGIQSLGKVLSQNVLGHRFSEGHPRAPHLPEHATAAFEQSLARYRLDVSLSFTQVDIAGNEVLSSAVIAPAAGFTAISLHNVPRSGDSGRICDPRTEWLDMCVADFDTVYKSRKKIKCFNDLKGCQTYHTSRVQVEALERHKTFSILLDGELYGPFYRIRIEALRIGRGGRVLKLPAKHFLPFQM